MPCSLEMECIATVYQKETYNSLYLHWDAFARISWKQGILKTLVSLFSLFQKRIAT